MFSVPTVFIIGAGAGKEVGMPIGSELSVEIARKLDIKHKDFGPELTSGDSEISAALRRIANAKGDNYNEWRTAGTMVAAGIGYTRSIDAYLNAHKDNEKIKVCGKLAIAHSVLAYERLCALYVDPMSSAGFANRLMVERSWFSDLLYLMQDRIVASENLDKIFDNLCVINFNYDRCVEQFLFYALQHLYQIDQSRAFQLMQRLMIFHPYGQVGFMQWEPAGRRQVGFGATDYGELVELSGEIRTFNEQLEDKGELSAIREQVGNAQRIVFLGFHFHHQNLELLKASGPNRGNTVTLYATALDRSRADHDLIDGQLRAMLSGRGGGWNISIALNKDCKGLFKDYSATWLR
jgi:hypothetical protein